MPVIPENTNEFQDPAFWKEFYKNSQETFEWYGDFNNFGQILVKYMKPTDKILQIGCGSSNLASQLYDNGYRAVDSIDIDQGVIDQQIAKNNVLRPQLRFSCCPASQIDSPPENYNVVVDKGTLDSLLPSEEENGMEEEVIKMFEEVSRVLSIGGRYIVITLAQKQVLNLYLLHFLERKNFMIRVQKNSDIDWRFQLPVFLLIATKLRFPLPSPYMEIIPSSQRKAVKLLERSDLIVAVNAEQEFSRFCHLCSRKLNHEATMALYDCSGKLRYNVAVVDDPEASVLLTFAVFIIPVGRDHDWIFATEKGRLSLRKHCNRSRLAVVTLNRDQIYGTLEQVKDELRPYMLQITPKTLIKSRGPSIEYLSLGEVDVKKTRASGHSDLNGPWTVEDIHTEYSIYRRLVFLSEKNLVQSEAKVIKDKNGGEVVDLHNLSSEYHEAMLAALPFMLPPGEKLKRSTKSRLLVVGLGGGVLPSFLHLMFPMASVTAVELDDAIPQIAKEWFSFNCDSRLTVVVKDALSYVEELVEKKDRSLLFDIIFIDVAGSIQEDGLSCPSPSFVTEEMLTIWRSALRERGVLVLNLVTRNDEVAEQVKKRVLSVFTYYFMHCGEEDINQVLICPKVRVCLMTAQKACKHLKREKSSLRNMFANVSALKVVEKSKASAK